MKSIPDLSKPSLSTARRRSSPSRHGLLTGNQQITRSRVIYNCLTCRRRKVKCDKVRPVCGNCAKNSAECVYDEASQKDETPRRTRRANRTKRRSQIGRSLEENRDEYLPIQDRSRQAELSNGQKTDANPIEARLDKLTMMIEPLQGKIRALEAAAIDASMETALKEQSNSWANSTCSRPATPSGAAADRSSDASPLPSDQAPDLVDSLASLKLGHLSLGDGGRSRYVGTTYWAYISHEIDELNQLLRNQNQPHDLSASDNDDATEPVASAQSQWRGSAASSSMHSTPSHSIPGSLQQATVFQLGYSAANENAVEPDMLDHIPTKRQSHVLYKSFMSGVHALSPTIHPPMVLKFYNAFWDWYDYNSYSGEPCPDPSFIPLLYAIWYGGSVTISMRTIEAEFDVSSRFALSTKYSEEVTSWLAKISFPRSTSLLGLAAYLISQTILSREEEPITSSLFVSLAVRVAQTMGLHRDPAQFDIEPCEAEFRRRVWWHIMHMDSAIAISSGLPPMLSDENYWDVRETSEIKDTLLGTAEAKEYERLVASGQRLPDDPDDPTLCGGPSMVNVYYLSARAKCVMAQTVRRILRIQLGTKPLTRKDMEELHSVLHDVQGKLNSIVNRIPESKNSEGPAASSGRAPFMSKSPVLDCSTSAELPDDGRCGCPEQYHSPVLVAFYKWARIILSLFIDKAFCVAYQPFLKNHRSRIWPLVRQSALCHCYAFTEKYIRLATDPDFQPFQWGWPGNHQPMHATMIMLIDSYERPHSPEASKSRAFIDRILALSGPDGGVVGAGDAVPTQRPLRDGGREAWDMIRRLRRKAWEKAGLSPQFLRTGQDQTQKAAVTSPASNPNRMSHSWPPSAPASPASPATALFPLTAQQSQPIDFNGRFQNMTRSQMFSTPADSVAATAPAPDPRQPLPSSTTVPLMNSACPNSRAILGPTPPSMVDPYLNFDWDEWDAVFGQSLPIADDFMDLDAATSLAFADLENAASGSNDVNQGFSGVEL